MQGWNLHVRDIDWSRRQQVGNFEAAYTRQRAFMPVTDGKDCPRPTWNTAAKEAI
jgi:hypothetical protein